uniref:Peptidase S54 rhomboid domain-containing protein n=2 Tax=Latimeria chalumnae TaxID=7897 RepID=H3B361_LATCH
MVTIGVLLLNVTLYYYPLEALQKVCISLAKVWHKGQWSRLFLATVHHVNFSHLCFNMVALAWNGWHVEQEVGSAWFAYMLLSFAFLTGLLHLLLKMVVAGMLGDPYFEMYCAVGFSAVLFALKIIRYHSISVEAFQVFGFSVTAWIVCSLELFLIHLLSPRASFTGHLSGILVGLAYVTGPLKTVM